MESKQLPPKINYEYYIGIDCGVETGIACWWKPKKELTSVTSCSILKAINSVKWLVSIHPGAIKVRVEDARLRKWIPQQKNEKAERGRREGAGSVKRDAQIWEEFLTDAGIPFELVAPKDNKTKMEAGLFKKMTGWHKPTNNHGRDAAMLVFGF